MNAQVARRASLVTAAALLAAACSFSGLPGVANQSNAICAPYLGSSTVQGVTLVNKYLCVANPGTVLVVVEVRNDANAPIKLGGANSESFSLLSKDGSELDSGELRVLPQYLGPGEVGYLGGWATGMGSPEVSRIDKVAIVVAAASIASVPAQTLKANNVVVGVENGTTVATGTVTNSGSITVYLGVVGVVLLDASGIPLGWLMDDQTASGLRAGESAAFSTIFPVQPDSIASMVKSTKVFAFDLELF